MSKYTDFKSFLLSEVVPYASYKEKIKNKFEEILYSKSSVDEFINFYNQAKQFNWKSVGYGGDVATFILGKSNLDNLVSNYIKIVKIFVFECSFDQKQWHDEFDDYLENIISDEDCYEPEDIPQKLLADIKKAKKLRKATKSDQSEV